MNKQTVNEKIISAKSIVQAALAAYDTEALVGENYDMHWPLKVAIDLLEEASDSTVR
jgi:hypothetical protein